MGKIIGIDLGTTNSCVSVMELILIRSASEELRFLASGGCQSPDGSASVHQGTHVPRSPQNRPREESPEAPARHSAVCLAGASGWY